MLSIAVCDGNKEDLKATQELIRASTREYNDKNLRIETFAKPFDFFEAVGKGKFYDIYILETQLVGFSGIDVARDLRNHGIDKPIIFITASKDYALEAFEVDALQYLMKPVSRPRLSVVLHRAIVALQNERRRQIVFKTAEGFYHVFIRDIIFTATDGKYQLVRVKGGRELRVRTTATEMSESLVPHKGFVRCGSSYTLNIYHIDHYDSKSVVMTDGSVLPVPRGAYAKLSEAYRDCFSLY